jgi:gamma-glutamylcyclotransferase (GGCT)/AIG2-like uncharacterized protein YtfP
MPAVVSIWAPRMTALLFVYGSLMPHLKGAFATAERDLLRSQSASLGSACIAADLHDLGEFPGLSLLSDVSTNSFVHGVLLRLHEPAATLAWLDPFEDIDPATGTPLGVYVRTLAAVIAEDAEVRQAWVYALRRVPAGAAKITSGKWQPPIR